MFTVIPQEILSLHKKMEENGYETYFVGGCVRDMQMDVVPKDWDFATRATPEEILKVFPDGFYDNKFGTVGVPITIGDEKHVLEITTYRTERGYSDRRRPDQVTWGKTIEEDLARRDFTMNAIAFKPPSELADPFKGREDLTEKTVRAVGDPNIRFKEDALRLMRAIRFAATLSFTIEEKTWAAILSDAKLITDISGERIRDELLKILASNFPYEGVMLLKNSGLLAYILPELLMGIDVSQVRPGRHHTTDVFTHNVMSLKLCPSKDPIVRFATLLHDVGKPAVLGKDQEGLVTFHNHEIVGARIVKDICQRLHFSKKEEEKIITLIRWHMFSVNENMTDSAIRRFIRRIGVENVSDMMDLRVGDRLGGGTQTAESWRLKLFKKRVEEQLQPAPFSINDLAVNGHDVMKELDIKPGPKVGEILQKLFEEVDEDLSKNTKEYLLERLKGFR